MRLMLIPIFGLLIVTARAQDMATDSSGDYMMDLGQVYGAIRLSNDLASICTRAFPEQGAANAAAYKQWRKNYLPFLQEMERHFSTMVWREADGDPKEHVAILNEYQKSLDGYRDALSTQLRSEGSEVFEKQCSVYPTYLDSPRMNLEAYYSEHVAVVRKGPAE